VLSTLQRAGMTQAVVVTGTHHDAITDVLAASPAGRTARFVRNTTPGADQLSSLLCGLEAVDGPEVDGVLVALVDHPFVATSTVTAVVERFLSTRAPVVRPVCRGRHGHPVIFAREVFDSLRAARQGGAKAVVRAYAGRSLPVEVEDEGIWTDVDTPENYRAALARFGSRAEE
jgi:molybdenum cofactor cytidylyltransferase